MTSSDADFTVRGAGSDIWGTHEAFNYFYEGMNGDGQMQIRVTSLDNTDSFAKAGVMIRASADPASAHVILDVRPDGALEFMKRDAIGNQTIFLNSAQVTFPVTLQLRRSGDTFSASYSQNGQSWTLVAPPRM